ncbi:MAG: coniferyl aldehyde dehydrogenase [Defluviicoccus sp.]|nr:coniferyl aldehyde dehydrogenase [Defluviicoccus sp.]
MVSPDSASIAADVADLRRLFDAQRSAAAQARNPGHDVRARQLSALERLVHDNVDDIAAAISADFGWRSAHETRLLEIFPSLEAIRHARRHLKRWMRPERRPVSLWFQPGRAEVIPQPLGVVGVIVPWNYPVYLAVGPLVGALAAGNRAMVKMSELTPATAALFARLVAQYFAPEELTVVTGEASVAQAFARLPFDHLLFTGSTKVGHSVMAAAAENLTPVTLELGGKSPAIIGPGCPIAGAAERIVVGKCMNAGQTCIAPDYVLVPAGKELEFVAAARAVVARCYPDMEHTADYSTIINPRHFARLIGCLDDARAKGAELVSLAPAPAGPDAQARRLPPTVVLKVSDTMLVMQEEIFGPLLPVVPYRDLSAAIAYVNARSKPLALYYFDHDSANIRRVLSETVSGGVTVNDTILHIAQDDLPFGGVGTSGMGHYHGREGFDTFTKRKAVFHQARINGMGLFMPPYGRLFDRLVRILLR